MWGLYQLLSRAPPAQTLWVPSTLTIAGFWQWKTCPMFWLHAHCSGCWSALPAPAWWVPLVLAHRNPGFVHSPLLWSKASLGDGASRPTPWFRGPPTGNYNNDSFPAPHPFLHSSHLPSHSYSRFCSSFLILFLLLSPFLFHTLNTGPHQLICFNSKETMVRPPSLLSECCFLTLVLGS